MADDILIHRLSVPPYDVQTYLVACTQTRRGAVIDPAGDEENLLKIIREEGIDVRYILNTHGHADHVVANRLLKQHLNAPVCMHEADDRFFADPRVREASEKELGLPPPQPADRLLKDGETLALGMLTIGVIHTPGHTPGSVCFMVDGNLFTGDTLFVGAVGRTDLTGGSFDTLLDSLSQKLIVLPPETVIWPGHDYGESPTSTIAREIRENPYITDFILDI
jgi:glyoxylase-like metal-dependent hydrolase (beta-lactamase superfamily II)